MNRGIRTSVLAAALCTILASNTARAGEMHDAAAEGDLKEIKRLLAKGVEVDQKGIASPLFFAARSGQLDAVTLLMDNGADVNLLSKWGTALHIATQRGHIDVVRTLLVGGADPTISGGEDQTTPLHEAARKGSLEAVRLLLAQGADPNARNRLFEPPLHFARNRGHDQVAAILIEAGARPKSVEPISDKIAQANLEAGRLNCGVRRHHFNLVSVLQGASPCPLP